MRSGFPPLIAGRAPINQLTPRGGSRLLVGSMVIERNSPCPCGSGKKYKKCCLVTAEAEAAAHKAEEQRLAAAAAEEAKQKKEQERQEWIKAREALPVPSVAEELGLDDERQPRSKQDLVWPRPAEADRVGQRPLPNRSPPQLLVLGGKKAERREQGREERARAVWPQSRAAAGVSGGMLSGFYWDPDLAGAAHDSGLPLLYRIPRCPRPSCRRRSGQIPGRGGRVLRRHPERSGSLRSRHSHLPDPRGADRRWAASVGEMARVPAEIRYPALFQKISEKMSAGAQLPSAFPYDVSDPARHGA